MRSGVVYCFYGADDELLYVGCTTNLKSRLHDHRGRIWWHEAERVEIVGIFELRDAQHIERCRIAKLAPKHNCVGNRRRGWGYSKNGPTYFPERDQFRAQEAA